jgi:hypothetical protein
MHTYTLYNSIRLPTEKRGKAGEKGYCNSMLNPELLQLKT